MTELIDISNDIININKIEQQLVADELLKVNDWIQLSSTLPETLLNKYIMKCNSNIISTRSDLSNDFFIINHSYINWKLYIVQNKNFSLNVIDSIININSYYFIDLWGKISKEANEKWFIEKYFNYIDFNKFLSAHRNCKFIDESFLDKYIDKIDTAKLCKYIELDDNLLEKYFKYINVNEIIKYQNPKEKFILKYNIDIKYFLAKTKFSIDILEKYFDKISHNKIYMENLIINQTLSIEFLEKHWNIFSHYIDLVCKYQKVITDFSNLVEKYKLDINLLCIAHWQLPEKVIENLIKNKNNRINILKHQLINENILELYINNFSFEELGLVISKQTLSDDFIKKYFNILISSQFLSDSLCSKFKLPIDLLEKHIDSFNFYSIIKNQNISVDFLIKYENKLDVNYLKKKQLNLYNKYIELKGMINNESNNNSSK